MGGIKRDGSLRGSQRLGVSVFDSLLTLTIELTLITCTFLPTLIIHLNAVE